MQIGFWVMALSKRTPSAARRSRCGVCTSGCPLCPSTLAWCWSENSSRMLGRLLHGRRHVAIARLPRSRRLDMALPGPAGGQQLTQKIAPNARTLQPIDTPDRSRPYPVRWLVRGEPLQAMGSDQFQCLPIRLSHRVWMAGRAAQLLPATNCHDNFRAATGKTEQTVGHRRLRSRPVIAQTDCSRPAIASIMGGFGSLAGRWNARRMNVAAPCRRCRRGVASWPTGGRRAVRASCWSTAR